MFMKLVMWLKRHSPSQYISWGCSRCSRHFLRTLGQEETFWLKHERQSILHYDSNKRKSNVLNITEWQFSKFKPLLVWTWNGWIMSNLMIWSLLKVNKTMTETRSLLIDYLNNPKQWYSMKLFIYKTRQDKINLSCIYDLQDKIDFIDP